MQNSTCVRPDTLVMQKQRKKKGRQTTNLSMPLPATVLPGVKKLALRMTPMLTFLKLGVGCVLLAQLASYVPCLCKHQKASSRARGISARLRLRTGQHCGKASKNTNFRINLCHVSSPVFVSAAPLRVHSLLPRDNSELEKSFTQQFQDGIDPKYIAFKSSRLLQHTSAVWPRINT